MDELIELLHDDGSFSGTSILKSEAHQKGLFHASAHIWICTPQNEVLIQKRAAAKDTFPNLWDVSVAGHVSFGETPLSSALREVAEEIGLPLQKEQLNFIKTFRKKIFHKNGLIDNELHYIYVVKTDFQIDALKVQASEVAALKLIPISSFLETVHHQTFVPHGAAYFDLIFEALRKLT